MLNVLITGGAGFVGRHFCGHFLDTGAKVTCIDPIVARTGGLPPDQWPFFNPLDFSSFTFHKIDCRDYFANSHQQFDLILHLAAVVGGRLMIDYNPLAVADDLAIDAMFWQWAKATKPKKVIYFSSSAAYPIGLQKEATHQKLAEELITFSGDIGMPDMTYGWAKLTGEYLARIAYERHGIPSTVYRPFSGYGPDQDLTYPFPAITKRILDLQEQTLTVWGSGRQMRDFVHIRDCVECVIQTHHAIHDASAINISSGDPVSFIDLARSIVAVAGKSSVSVRGQADKPEGVFARYGDTKKQRDLGFIPKISLNKGIEEMLQFQEKRIVGGK